MENKIVTAIFKDSTHTKVSDVWQWDYGQILRIQGLDLPTAVEVDFAVAGASESIARIGTTKDGVTDVVIPDSLIETGKNLVAYIYLRDSASGNTEYQIDMLVTKRAKPEAYDRPEDKKLFGQAIEAVNTAADRAEKAGQTAQEAAQKAGLDAEQTAQDRAEVAKMVETVSDISEQVKKVEQLSQQAQEAATKTEADAQQTAEDRVEVGKMLETVKDVSEQVKSVEESVRKAKESEQAAAEHRTAVEQMKESVEQAASTFPQKVQEGVQTIENAGTAEVQEITQAGTAQKTAVEGAGTQAVQSVENVKASAIEAVGAEKTAAVQAVQSEGTKQTGNVTAEGTKQVKAVQDKGAEVLQSIPEDFATQMETKLDKQQGIENKGKALVIGEDGNVVPEKVASGGGDGIAIINTMSGESPLVIPDSAERVNERLELGGKTEQVTTTGKNLFDSNIAKNKENYKEVTIAGSVIYAIELSLKPNTKYAFQCVIKSVPTTMNVGNSTIRYVVSDGQKRVITTNEDGKLYIGFSGNPDGEIHKIGVSIVDIQVEESTTVTPYEPYTGGKPSPSPEYPQEIKNVGKWNDEKQKYEVTVKINNANLLNEEDFFDMGNWKSYQYHMDLAPNTKYTFSRKDNSGINSGLFLSIKETAEGTWSQIINSNSASSCKQKVTFTTNESGKIYFLIQNNESVNLKDFLGYAQLEVGTIATQHMKYTEQPLTLTSDRPITKWDRLVEQGGQIGWLYQSAINEYRGDTAIAIYGTGFYFLLNNKKLKSGEGYCEELKQHVPSDEKPYISFNMSPNTYAYTLNTQAIYGSTVSAIKEYLKTHPLHLVYKTETTEFIPLPQSEQNAIRALKTYYHTTVITADGGELDPDIKVTYTADTKNYIDGKVSAKVASILRQYQADTANLLSLMPMETQATMIENDTNNILNNLESEEAHE